MSFTFLVYNLAVWDIPQLTVREGSNEEIHPEPFGETINWYKNIKVDLINGTFLE